jgi:hypothetical protein
MENIFAKIAQDTTKFDLGDEEVQLPDYPDDNLSLKLTRYRAGESYTNLYMPRHRTMSA